MSLAVDRQAINEAELAGVGKIGGNWINNDVQYAIEWPAFERDVERARQLLRKKRVIRTASQWTGSHLYRHTIRVGRASSLVGEIGIRAKLQVMEQGVFLQKLQGGLKEWPGVQILFNATRMGGTWSNWYEAFFKCGGFSVRDRMCVRELDAKFAQYEQSVNPAERQKLAEDIQRSILSSCILYPSSGMPS